MAATVLITRPIAQARAFAQALEDAFGEPLRTVISPLIETVAVPVDQDFADVAHVVFTSVNGVQQASRIGLPTTATAWCVGAKTADAAQTSGFIVRVAEGNSESLVSLIVAGNPSGRMVHVRGKYAAGDVLGGLALAGIMCEPIVAYDQLAIAPTQQALDLLSAESPVIVPLFSPRTAKLFAQIDAFRAPLHIVAISPSIEFPEEIVPVSSVAIAGIDGMVKGTLACYGQFSP